MDASYYPRDAAEQDARVTRANSAPIGLPTCCEHHGFFGPEGCREGKDCPDGRVKQKLDAWAFLEIFSGCIVLVFLFVLARFFYENWSILSTMWSAK